MPDPDAGPIRLYVNVDHIATVREARKTTEPDPVEAALLAEDAGAHGITAHLREDRRHIQDRDIQRLKDSIRTVLNLEIAFTDEMLRIAEDLHPYQVTFVPERREELTTEGGLNLMQNSIRYEKAIRRMRDAGIRPSLFLDPVERDMDAARDLGAVAVELHTGAYAREPNEQRVNDLYNAGRRARSMGMNVHLGHGLTTANVGPLVQLADVEEVNIGHHIVSRAVLVGMQTAVREMLAALQR